ncbi:hypothetical protein [Micromonospora sp. CA-111912]|uniref:hypothetical protein n=1 Tax=Micromonospora sp. CA-111912 TaxID=3239955 RepID=UPI003D9102F4
MQVGEPVIADAFEFAPDIDMIGDGGYQDIGLLTPHREPPGGDLTAKQKTYNYSLDRLPAPPRRV